MNTKSDTAKKETPRKGRPQERVTVRKDQEKKGLFRFVKYGKRSKGKTWPLHRYIYVKTRLAL